MAAETWDIVSWAYVIVGLAGFLAGLLYRVSALIFLTFITFVAVLALALGQGWPFWSSLLNAFGMIILLQLAYLLGVALAAGGSPVRAALKSRLQSLFGQDTAR